MCFFFILVEGCPTMTANVLRFGDVAESLHESLFGVLNFELAQMFFQDSSPAILPTRCYTPLNSLFLSSL